MKRSTLTLAGLIFLVILIIHSCKKSDDESTYKCETCVTQPEAVAANNTSSKGIYKGVLIGSTGVIKFNIMNTDNTIKATLIIDGVTVNLTTTDPWVANQTCTLGFTGTLNGQSVTVKIEVGANGSNPKILSAYIPGHPNLAFLIAKETSVGLIECFEGTYTTTQPSAGTFNMLVSRSLGQWYATHRDNNQTTAEEEYGTIDANSRIINPSNVVYGTITGDIVSGTFGNGGGSVTINGKRTM